MTQTSINYAGVNLEVVTETSDMDGSRVIVEVLHCGENIFEILTDEQFTDLEKLVDQKIKQERVEALER